MTLEEYCEVIFLFECYRCNQNQHSFGCNQNLYFCRWPGINSISVGTWYYQRFWMMNDEWGHSVSELGPFLCSSSIIFWFSTMKGKIQIKFSALQCGLRHGNNPIHTKRFLVLHNIGFKQFIILLILILSNKNLPIFISWNWWKTLQSFPKC